MEKVSMSKSYVLKPTVLALAISALLTSYSVQAAITSTLSDGGNTLTVEGDGSAHSAPIIERSGEVNDGVHQLIVKNLTLDPAFTSDLSFTDNSSMIFKAGISLGGNNGTLGNTTVGGSDTYLYGDLSMTVLNSSISGSSPIMSGLYLRTDSVDGKSTVVTNSKVDVSGESYVRGILAESFGENGLVDVTLAEGAEFIITRDSTVATTIRSGGIVIQAPLGAAQVVTERGTSINGFGDNVYGIIAAAGRGSVIKANGSIETRGADSSAIYIGAYDGYALDVENTGSLTTSNSRSHGIEAVSSGSGTSYITNSGNITVSGDDSNAIKSTSTGGDVVVNHQAGGVLTSTSVDQNDGRGDAILVMKSSGSSGNIAIYVDGDIETSSANRSGGAFAHHMGKGDATVIGTGNVTTHGTLTNASNVNKYSYGLAATVANNALSEGNARVEYSQGIISTGGDEAYALYAGTGGVSGNSSVINSGTLRTSGKGSYGIWARVHNTTAGDAYVSNSGSISTTGDQAHGVMAESAGGKVEVLNTGNITTSGYDASGIRVHTSGSVASDYDVNVISSGNIDTDNSNSDGIFVTRTESTSGDINITASGQIDLSTDTPDARSNFGIYANVENADSTGNINVNFTGGTINNGTNGGDGFWISNKGQGSVDIKNNGTLLALGEASNGIRISSLLTDNTGEINVTLGADSDIQGGTTTGSGLSIAGTTAAQKIDNAGKISALNDRAIVSTGSAGSQFTLNNSGHIIGMINLGASDSVVTNQSGGIWELRNFEDTDSDGIRDMKGVAVADFGSGNDTFINEAGATLRLGAVSGATHNEPGGEFLVIGALSSFGEGTVHGQLINLNRFENSGTIDMTANGQAGDLLIITGSGMAGNYGGGQFVSNGGILRLDTHLNKGHNDSLSDILVVDDVILGANGPTQIIINRVDGSDELTEGNGIKVVKVLGSAEANSFVLGNVVKGGIYEYTLHQGEPDEGATTFAGGVQNWYLRNRADQLNPDLGTYLSNQTAATGLFIHSLHDRLGEPQYAERYNNEGAQPSMWVRALTTNTKNEAGGGLIGQNTTGSLVHMGGDVAQWSSNGNNRYHLGLMAAYGKSETTSRSHTTGSRSKGKIDGYGAGAYFTWYSNESMPEGTYVDLWSMYNWFDNEVEGAAKYDSKAWTSSLEIGHAVTGWQGQRMQVMIEPHAQVAYTTYSSDEHTDTSGVKMTDEDADGFYTRLGARTYLRDSLNSKKAQPFIEANWLHSTAKNTLRFNGVEMADNTPKDRFELKVGVQGEITKNLQVYSHIGLQWGKEDYSKSEGMLGLKYRF